VVVLCGFRCAQWPKSTGPTSASRNPSTITPATSGTALEHHFRLAAATVEYGRNRLSRPRTVKPLSNTLDKNWQKEECAQTGMCCNTNEVWEGSQRLASLECTVPPSHIRGLMMNHYRKTCTLTQRSQHSNQERWRSEHVENTMINKLAKLYRFIVMYRKYVVHIEHIQRELMTALIDRRSLLWNWRWTTSTRSWHNNKTTETLLTMMTYYFQLTLF